jgi:hypothetical protein
MKGAAAYVVIFMVPFRCSFGRHCSFVLEHPMLFVFSFESLPKSARG